jgi:hypothetical protein
MTVPHQTAIRSRTKTLAMGLALVFSSLLLAGCEEEEQDRVLMFEKGTYLGKQDNPMGDTQAEDLRQRARNQGVL